MNAISVVESQGFSQIWLAL